MKILKLISCAILALLIGFIIQSCKKDDTTDIPYQEIVNIPDANFKAALVGNTNINTNGDAEIQVSEAIAFTGEIQVAALNIGDLTGIEAFTKLTQLNCSENDLNVLNVTANTKLRHLAFGWNNISSIDVTANTELTFLSFQTNIMTGSIDLSNNTLLDVLSCQGNSLSSIDLSANTLLTNLDCSWNNLTELDVSANVLLTQIRCTGIDLTMLNIQNGNNSNLIYFNALSSPNLSCIQVDDEAYMNANWPDAIPAQSSYSEDCQYDAIVQIPDANFKAALVANNNINTNGDAEIQVSEAISYTEDITVADLNIADLTGIEAFINITELNCSKNQILSLHLSANTHLEILVCSENEMEGLDVSANTKLEHLNFGWNYISTIDVTANTELTELVFHENGMTDFLDLSNNTKLTALSIPGNFYTNIDLSANTLLTNLNCDRNSLTELDLSEHHLLTVLHCKNNDLELLNLKNGNNSNLVFFDASGNASLSCVQVDDETYMNTNWPDAISDGSYDVDCGYW